MIGEIKLGELMRLLETPLADDPSSLARRIASKFDPNASLPVAAQPAGTTAETLRVKYSLTSSRGATVIGLDRLTQRLTQLSGAPVAGCVVEGTADFALVFFTEDVSELVGVLYVATIKPRPHAHRPVADPSPGNATAV